MRRAEPGKKVWQVTISLSSVPEIDAKETDDGRLGLQGDLVPREAVLPEEFDGGGGVAARVRRLGRHSRVVGSTPEPVATCRLLSSRLLLQTVQFVGRNREEDEHSVYFIRDGL